MRARNLLLFGGGGRWTPKALFASGAAGDYWDAAVLASLAQNSDGSTSVTEDDPVGYWAGQRGEHDLVQVTDASRPLLKLDARGVPYIEDDDTNDWLTVLSSESLFKYLHDGTGGSAWLVVSCAAGESKQVIGTCTNNTAIGFRIVRSNATSRPSFEVGNGSGAVITATPASGTPWPADTPLLVTMTYSSADGCKGYINETLVASGSELATPSTSNSALTFRVPGATTSGNNKYAVGTINRVLTPAEVNRLVVSYRQAGKLS